MARDITEDFKELQDFVRSYAIRNLLDDAAYRTLLSQQHKKYHAVLTLLSELQHQGWKPVDATGDEADETNKAVRERLAEFASDLGSGLFVWVHGAYKPARLILRSSIENLLKAIGVISHPQILSVTSVYEVFDLAEAQPFFTTADNGQRMRALRDTYNTLCLDVHTATPEQMEQVGALSFFPRFVREDADSFAKLFGRTATVGLEIACLMFPGAYRNMHYRNRDIVNASLGAPARAELNSQDRTGQP